MIKKIVFILAFALAFMMAVTMTFAQTTDSASGGGTHKYIGAEKCKLCHSTEKIGAQFKIWEASKHAQAYADLASDTAKAVAKARGIDDPQKAPQCLKCHETGYGQPGSMFEATFNPQDGIQCESCHGPGSDYWKMSTMKGIHEKTVKAEDVGLIMPTKELCVTCHNQESPFYHGFDFSADSAKIAHPLKGE
jgi:RecJ-like exonuclease